MGISVRTKKSGEIFYEFRVYGKDGNEVTTRWQPQDGWSASTIEKRKNAAYRDFEKAVKAGEIVSKKEQKKKAAEKAAAQAKISTLSDYALNVFMPAKEITIAESTRISYIKHLNNHILPALGNIRITDITASQINTFLLNAQSSGLSHGSIIGLYVLTNQIFKQAYITDEIIDRNPMDKVKRPKPRKDEVINKSVKTFSDTELKEIRDILIQNKIPIKWSCFIMLLMASAIRSGECCGLKWEDIVISGEGNNKTATITIRRNIGYSKTKGVYETTPKSKRIRTIPITDGETIAILERYRDSIFKKTENTHADNNVISFSEKRRETPHGFVFPYVSSDFELPMNPQVPTNYIKRFGKKFGIPDCHPHKFRHTFASIGVENGAAIPAVSAILGHADSATTMRIYVHTNEEAKVTASNIVTDALKSKIG